MNIQCHSARAQGDDHARRHRAFLPGGYARDHAHHTLEMPITPDQARTLKVGDTVTLEKTLYGIRDAT